MLQVCPFFSLRHEMQLETKPSFFCIGLISICFQIHVVGRYTHAYLSLLYVYLLSVSTYRLFYRPLHILFVMYLCSIPNLFPYFFPPILFQTHYRHSEFSSQRTFIFNINSLSSSLSLSLFHPIFLIFSPLILIIFSPSFLSLSLFLFPIS